MTESESFFEAADAVNRPVIAVTAPARACVLDATGKINEARIEAAASGLRALGWDVLLTENVALVERGFGGTDAVRARELMRAMTDPAVDVVMPIRGGYGTARLLPLLDWEALRHSQAVFVGLSDLTAFNLALFAQTRRASWQGPVAAAFANPNAARDAAFMRAMSEGAFYLEEGVEGDRAEVEGILWGGNLTVLASLLGTPYFPDIEDGILYVEDINEPAWRIERLFNQLIQSGVLGSQRLIVVGDTTGCDAGRRPGAADFNLADALNYVRCTTGVPVASGLTFGHVPDTATLPFGVPARVVCDGTMISIEVDRAPVPTLSPAVDGVRGPNWWV